MSALLFRVNFVSAKSLYQTVMPPTEEPQMAFSLWYVAAALIGVVFYFSQRLRKTLPPGPPPVVFLGNFFQFFIGRLQGKSNVDMMGEWKDVYGPVYTIWLGPVPVVLVCDYKTATDVYVKNGAAHVGRPTTFVMQKPRESLGIVFDDGPSWMEHRRFALRTLRKFGLGRNIMQTLILEETFHQFEVLDAKIEQGGGRITMDPTPLFDVLIASIINKLIAGYRYEEGDIEFASLKHNLDIMMERITPLDQVIFNNYTYKLPFLRDRWSVLSRPQIAIIDMMKRQIKDRQADIASGRRHIDVNDEGEDYIDAFLIEMKRREESGADLEHFTENHLAANLIDLWVAGTETSITTVLWSFIYLLNYTEIQAKMRAEMTQITQGNRPVELTDKSQMPYTCAVITECFRCSTALNFNIFHQTTCETQVGEWILPAGTITTPQVSVIATDKHEFVNPDQFDPERYMKNKNLEKQVIPFSVGKRSCLGEGLARAELFLIVANCIQRYRISVPDGREPPSMKQLSLKTLLKRTQFFEMTIERVD